MRLQILMILCGLGIFILGSILIIISDSFEVLNFLIPTILIGFAMFSGLFISTGLILLIFESKLTQRTGNSREVEK